MIEVAPMELYGNAVVMSINSSPLRGYLLIQVAPTELYGIAVVYVY